MNFPAYNIGMDKALWGLTLFSSTHFIARIIQLAAERPKVSKHVDINVEFFNKFLKHCQNLELIEPAEESGRTLFNDFKEKYIN